MAALNPVDPMLKLRDFQHLYPKKFIKLGDALILERDLWRKTLENLPQFLNG